MAVTVDWSSKVISVPQSDLTLISGTLYELDTDWLRLQLKDLEDDAEGMPFLDTHRHNTEVTIAGVTYARFFEIINGYTLQFTPAGNWTVALTGTNNNVFDPAVLVLNGVSVIGNNSAGLVVTGGGSAPTAAQVADAVWDEALSGHLGAGSTGEALDGASTGADPAAVADAVWDESLAGHAGAGSTGLALADALAAAAAAAQPGDPMTLTAGERDAIADALLDLAAGVETGHTLRQALRLILASQVGILAGASGTNITIRDPNDTKNRIVATVDADGNRISVTTDAT